MYKLFVIAAVLAVSQAAIIAPGHLGHLGHLAAPYHAGVLGAGVLGAGVVAPYAAHGVVAAPALAAAPAFAHHAYAHAPVVAAAPVLAAAPVHAVPAPYEIRHADAVATVQEAVEQHGYSIRY